MTADLHPDVRDRAARAAYEVNGLTVPFQWDAVVDAVAAVFAPEIARPLQARITELERLVAVANSAQTGLSIALAVPANSDWSTIRTTALALKARIDVLSPMVEDLTEISREAEARIELLTAALTEITREDCLNRVVREDGYCFERWPDGPLWCMPCTARAALAAGETESEGP